MRPTTSDFADRIYDAVVIGSGIGGLVCAARLARSGQDVLMLEQHFLPGGYCTSYHRKGYTLDATVDAICGLEEGSQFRRILDDFDITRRLRFLRLDPIRENIFGDFSVRIPADVDRYRENLAQRYPGEAAGLVELFRALKEILQGLLMMPVEQIWDGGNYEKVFPALARFRRNTWQELLEEFLQSRELMSVLSERCCYIGLPPSRVSALSMATMLMSYFEGGAWRVAGGYQNLTDALVACIAEAGSQVVLQRRVEQLLVKNDRVEGVVLEDGREVRAKRVISNADAGLTLQRLLPRDQLSAEMHADLESRRRSHSFVVVHIGVRRDLSTLPYASSLGYFPGGDVERGFAFTAPPAEDPDIALGVLIPTLEDPSVAPAGRSMLCIHYLCPSDLVEDWNQAKEAIGQALVRRVEEIIPNLLNDAELFSVATPRTMEHYTLNLQGAAYGWEQSPERFAFLGRLREALPEGLHMVGHWTDWGGGVVAAACSGYEEGRRILRISGG